MYTWECIHTNLDDGDGAWQARALALQGGLGLQPDLSWPPLPPKLADQTDQ